LRKSQDPIGSRELIEASIEQKSSQIVVFPIAKAIDFSSNRKYLKYLLPLVVMTIGIFIFYPSVFLDASERLLQPTKTFVKPAPFQFVVENEALQVVRNEDFTLKNFFSTTHFMLLHACSFAYFILDIYLNERRTNWSFIPYGSQFGSL
jgi:hypothetical protein